MIKSFHNILWLAAGFLFAVTACAGEPVDNPIKDKQMKQQFTTGREQSPWQGYTASAAEEQAGKSISATAITDTMERLPHLSDYTLDGLPFLAIDRQARRVVINQNLFSSLTRADATRARSGEKLVIGRITESRLLQEPWNVFAFLLESQIIETYWHIGATIKLVETKESGSIASASFSGVHTYYTNKKNEEEFKFVIRLDRKNGDIWIEGL
ncbi:MAG: hypothetical protein EHM28_01505 [Spirochaetaceae bacterium]|nr:MAG: hypothetical protein EHM28_01505 [Spirochaetaceae bacterium]